MKTKEKITLTEAATLLGVSKETLRNWDRSGKLTSSRNPINNYRFYDRNDVMLVKEGMTEVYHVGPRSAETTIKNPAPTADGLSEEQFKRYLARLQKILRDTDGDSSLVSRFDELTKLFFAKLLSEYSPDGHDIFFQLLQSDRDFAQRIRDYYFSCCVKYEHIVPMRFRTLCLSDSAIVDASKILTAFRLKGAKADFKGIAYEEFVRNTFDKGDNQQFFTPREIATFLVAMVGPKLRGVIGDPASGTGGFLVEALKQGHKPRHIIALEIDDRLAWVTGINLFANGANSFESICLGNGGSLGQKGRPYFGKFNVIVTNPPFGSDFSEVESLSEYELGRNQISRRRGILFVERCLDLLSEDGILAMVIDEGVLSLPSSEDVRRLIHKKADLLAVISLPETAFMPYASVNTSIIILQKTTRPSKSTTTFFARSERVGRKPNGEPDLIYDDAGSPIPNSDLEEILASWNEFRTTGTITRPPENVFLANPFTQAHRDATLRLDSRYHHPARLNSIAIINECKSPLATLAELCIERNEIVVPSLDFADQFIIYTGLAQIEPRNGRGCQISVPAQSLKSSVKKYYKHDILFARMRPNLRKCLYIEFEDPGYTSPECIVFTVRQLPGGRTWIDPLVLSILLRSNFVYGQIMHQVAGIGRPRISLTDLKQVKIPVPPPEIQAAIRRNFLKTQQSYETLKVQASQLMKRAEVMEEQAVEQVALGLCSV